MAYPVKESARRTSGSASACVITMPTHVAGDLLVCCIEHNGTGTYSSNTGGWTVETGSAANVDHNCNVLTKVAASGSESLTVTYSASTPFQAYTFIVRGQHATPIIGSARVAHASGKSGNSASGLDLGGYDNSLVIYFGAANQNNIAFQRFALDESNPLASDYRYDYDGAHVAIRQMGTYAADNTAPVVAHHWDATSTATVWTLAIRDAGTGDLMPYVDMGLHELAWYGTFGSKLGTITFGDPDDFAGVGVAINGITVDTAVTTPTTLSDTWGATSVLSNSTNYGTERIVGTYHTLSFPAMAAGDILSLEWQPLQSSTTQFGAGGGGYLFGLKDGTGNWLLWKLGHPTITSSAVWQRVFIELGSDVSLWAWSGASAAATLAAMDWADLVGAALMVDRASGTTALTSFYFKNLFCHHSAATISGGCAARPASLNELQAVAASYAMREIMTLQGTRQILSKVKAQIGDGGVIPMYFDASATAIEFPEAYVSTAFSDRQKFRVSADLVGMELYPAATDTMILAAGVANANQSSVLNVNASSSAAAANDFAGESIIGFNVTDSAGLSWASTTFKSGKTVTIAGGGDLTNCTISDTTSTNAALAITANGSEFDSCTIDGTGALYAWETGTAVTAITFADCTITAGSTDKGHVLKTSATVAAGAFVTGDHYEIKTVGTTDFTAIGASANTIGVRFTATGAGSGTGDAYAAVKITISGTTSLTEADVTSAGAVIWVAAPQPTLSATGLANTRYLLWNRTTSAELDNTFVAGTNWSKIITSGASTNDVLDLYTFKEGYEESVATIIYSGANASFAVSQATDDAIQYYRTQESITDYTTLTEFNFYSPDIYIQADDADGESTLKKLFIFYNGVLTTADGATYMRGGVTFRSPFDVVINRSVRAIAVDNVSVTHGLHFTDEDVIRVTTDDGTSWIAPPSAPGSIRYAFGVSPGQIETGVSGLTGPESAQLLAIPTTAAPTAAANASALLAAAATTPIAAEVKIINGVTLAGGGTLADPMRPA